MSEQSGREHRPTGGGTDQRRRPAPVEQYTAPNKETIDGKTKIVGTLLDHGAAIERLYKRIGDLQTTIADLAGRSNGADGTASKLSELLQAFDEGIEQLKAERTTDQPTSAYTAAIKSISDRLTSLEQTIGARLNELKDSTAAATKLVGTVGIVSKAVDNLTRAVQNIEVDLTPISDEIHTVQKNLTDKLTEQRAGAAETTKTIASLPRDLAAFRTELTGLTGIKTDVANLKTDLGSVKGQLGTVSTQLTGLTSQIAILVSRPPISPVPVDQSTPKKIEDLRHDIDRLATEIQFIKSQVSLSAVGEIIRKELAELPIPATPSGASSPPEHSSDPAPDPEPEPVVVPDELTSAVEVESSLVAAAVISPPIIAPAPVPEPSPEPSDPTPAPAVVTPPAELAPRPITVRAGRRPKR